MSYVYNGQYADKLTDLLPKLPKVVIDRAAMAEYLTFQGYLGGKTLIKGIRQELDVQVPVYELDFDHTPKWFESQLRALLDNAVVRASLSKKPPSCYISGGIDSSSVARMAGGIGSRRAYHGTFNEEGYSEKEYACEAARASDLGFVSFAFCAQDFIDNIEDVIRCIELPMMGPGTFSQYMLAKCIGNKEKIMLSGQGGDELFGGYARYIIAYFEQCFKAAIEGTMDNGNFVVTYESILPNLQRLKTYKPLMKHFFAEGLFDDMDKRYYRLISRADRSDKEIRWELLPDPFDAFRSVFYGSSIGHQSYFDLMTHYDFVTGLPAMISIEKKINAAHGLEVRFPFMNSELVQFAATIPSNVKFAGGNTKHVLKQAMRGLVPDMILDRKDKMGFPTPIVEWAKTNPEVRDFIHDTLSTQKARQRDFVDNVLVLENLEKEPKFGRKLWGFLMLELWCKEFLDKDWRKECAS